MVCRRTSQAKLLVAMPFLGEEVSDDALNILCLGIEAESSGVDVPLVVRADEEEPSDLEFQAPSRLPKRPQRPRRRGPARRFRCRRRSMLFSNGKWRNGSNN